MFKNSFIFFILSLFLSSCSKKEQVKCLPTNLEDNVIAFYPFTEGSLKDVSGNKNDLFNNSIAVPSKDRDNNKDCAYLFDNKKPNVSELKTIKSDFLNKLTHFSISTWYFNLDSINGFSSQKHLISRGNREYGEWLLGIHDLTRLQLVHKTAVWTTIPEPGKWHHVVGVKDSDNYKIYLDGIAHESKTFDPLDPKLKHMARDTGDFFIGRYFNGSIDDVIIFNKALSSTEVKQLYLAEPCCK